jgi:hypothetical protein
MSRVTQRFSLARFAASRFCLARFAASRFALAALFFLTVVCSSVVARADEEVVGGGEAVKPAKGYRWRRQQAWGDRPTSWFISGRIDLGVFFLRPRISIGYGRPHNRWIGIDLNPIAGSEGLGAYWGLRGSFPYFDVRFGARYQYTFRRSFLLPKSSFNREDIEIRDGPRSDYLSWEIEITSSIPVGPGALFGEAAVTSVHNIDDGFYVFEENVRAVINPPWVWRALAGYVFRLLPDGSLRVAVVGQVVNVPKRDLFIYRAGVRVRFRLAYNLELRGNFVPVVWSRDEIGAAGADTFQIGFRYLWAKSFL